MFGFINRDIVFAGLFVLIGVGAGFIIRELTLKEHKCPICPPQTVTNLYINNEKVKAKGNGVVDIQSIIKDNLILNNTKDTTKNKDSLKPKKRGFFGRIFNK